MFFSAVLAALFLIPASHILSASQVGTVLSPERFTRAAGPPATIVRHFTVPPAVTGPFTLTIDSGEADPRRPGALTNVARGTVLLNGVEIAGPSDLARQSHVERTVSLLPDNVLEITLAGMPGSHLTLGITGVVQVVISAIAPDNGPVGTGVLITGAGFDPIAANNVVSFNGAVAEVVNATTTAIQTIVPPDATTGPITVTTPNGSASSTPFTVTATHQLLISKSPDQAVYSRGQPITINAVVVDGNGLPVPNAVTTLTSTPAEDGRTGDTFVYHADGTYTITATADVGGQLLTASLTLTVQGAGATIACAPQFTGGMINGAPGAVLPFTGSVSSANGIAQFTVNGTDVAVAADGTFATAITSVWGVNTVELVLVDHSALTTRQLCSFVVSARWVGESEFNNDSVMLRLAQSAIDDTSRAGAFNSFADVLSGVINAPPIGDALHAALLAHNPLKPSSCDQSVFGVCVLRSEVLYLSSQLAGPNTVSLTLVNGGMMARVRFDDPRVQLRVRGNQAGIAYDVTGEAIFDFVEVDVTLDTGIDGAGRPSITVRAGSVATRVGSIVLNVSGVDGAVVDIVSSLVQGVVRNVVAGVLRDFVVSHFATVLDGIVSGLTVATLPGTFDVPRLQAGAPLAINFGVSFSSLGSNSVRALFGVGTRFTGPTAHARPSLGTPVQAEAFIDPLSGGRPVTEAFHDSLRGHALHAMWRAGYFDTILAGGALNGALPAGATLVTVATLPPVSRLRADGRTEIALGAMNVSLEHPALFAGTLQGRLAGHVSCDAQLNGDAIVLDACTVNEFHFAADRPLDAAKTAQINEMLVNVLNEMLSSAGGAALPTLPVPAFALPASLGSFGLPTTGALGLVVPSATIVPPHYLLRGGLGIR